MVWQGIAKIAKLLRTNVCYELGNGFDINLWLDRWIPTLDNGTPKPCEGAVDTEIRRVVELKDDYSNFWNVSKLR